MIDKLRLQNYRSYTDKTFNFAKTVNIIVGPNGSGKTNLLEAILVLAIGKSYRAKLPLLVNNSKDWSRVDGDFDGTKRTLKIKASDIDFLVDTKSYKRLGKNQKLPIVLFEPNHLQLVARGPQARRDWIDELISAIDPSYKTTLNSYNRTITQRNSLLKQPPNQISRQLFAWDIRLSELAGVIAQKREELILSANNDLSGIYDRIAVKPDKILLSYKHQFPVNSYSSSMLKRLQSELRLDVIRGFTGSGPHREDIELYINNCLITETASRGEVRSLLISLKIFELQLIENISTQKPILLLDDVFSELDSSRRKALTNFLDKYQTIITTTDADSITGYLKRYKLIKLTKGRSGQAYNSSAS